MTDLKLHTRETKLSDEEFELLPRNDDGDVIELSVAFIFLTPDQVEQLSSDDQSRYDDYQEEMRCLMAEAMAEFG